MRGKEALIVIGGYYYIMPSLQDAEQVYLNLATAVQLEAHYIPERGDYLYTLKEPGSYQMEVQLKFPNVSDVFRYNTKKEWDLMKKREEQDKEARLAEAIALVEAAGKVVS